MLKIENLHANVEGNEILNGINLEVKRGEVHAIMGPNGSGKSTLANVLSGNENYEVTAVKLLLMEKIFWIWQLKTEHEKECFWHFNTRLKLPAFQMPRF